jgi:hypothetical protein
MIEGINLFINTLNGITPMGLGALALLVALSVVLVVVRLLK